jgi:ubiquinone biosynthesis protein COQ9
MYLLNCYLFIFYHHIYKEAIKEGVAKSGLSPAATNGIFKNGAFDLIDFFYKKSNTELASYLEGLIQKGEIKSKNKLVREALLYRLQLTQPYIQHWPEVSSIQTF